MEKRIIKAIIVERQQEISKIQLVERPIYFEEQANYVLVGIRRAGKSYQMYQDIQNLVKLGKVTFEDCLYINFEDERISSIEASELGLLLECYAEMYDNQKILLGDIIARNEIRNSGAIRLLAKKLAESVMQPTTQTRLLHIVKSSGSGISRNTLADYLTYMNDVYLTFNIPNFTDSVAERMSSCKRYFYDNGLLSNFLINAETKLLENIVAVNLIERYGKEDRVFFYNKGISGNELDIEVVPVWKWLLRYC